MKSFFWKILFRKNEYSNRNEFELAAHREDPEEVDLGCSRLEVLVVRLHRLECAVVVRRDAAELRGLQIKINFFMYICIYFVNSKYSIQKNFKFVQYAFWKGLIEGISLV